MGRDPSPALAIVQVVEPLDDVGGGEICDEIGVQSGLEMKLRPLVYLGSSEAGTGPNENPGSLHKMIHQWSYHHR